jgi:hypothetical protein
VRAETKGVWGWIERQLLELQANPKKRERWFKVAWVVSTAFTAFGFFVIFGKIFGYL